MIENLREKTARSLLWNAIDKVGFQLIAFVVGIFTARLIAPKDFGLVGALAVFTAISNVLIESGFTQALVRRRQTSDAEYTATFIFNVGVSLGLYLLLFFSAPAISRYFRMPELTALARVLFLSLIANAFGFVQNVILTKEMAFKTLTRANCWAGVIAGMMTLGAALYGLGYWALAIQVVAQPLIRVILLWNSSVWRPSVRPDFGVISEIFSFSMRLLSVSLLNNLTKYLYNIFIGRNFSAQLGYYAQAQKYETIPSSLISTTLTGVANPVFAELNEDPRRQVAYLRKLVRIAAFLILPAMGGLLAVSEDFISVLLTDRWLPSLPYFRLLLIAGIALPFQSLFLNFLIIRGRSKRYMVAELFRNTLIFATLILGFRNIEQMLTGYAAVVALSLLLDGIFVWHECGYNLFQQIKDVLPYVAITVTMVCLIRLLDHYLPWSDGGCFITEIAAGALIYIGMVRLFGSKIFSEMTALFRSKGIL